MSERRLTGTHDSAALPALSVVMPVHNALPHLDLAVGSILGQTFKDFEFVILDDGSTDGSSERLRYWAGLDRRIRLFESKENLGPVGSSNLVANAAKSAFVARMDADDISYPERLVEQLQLLRENSDAGIVASLSDVIDAAGRRLRKPEHWRLSRRSVFVPFAHGAMMYRREIFDRAGGYRAPCEYWEDQDLIVRMAAIAKVLVVPWPLYRVRQSSTSTRVNCKYERLEIALDRFYRATDLLNEGSDYEQLVQLPVTNSKKLDPRVFISLGSLHLWAGQRPRLFLRFCSRAKVSWNVRTASAAVWTAWASLSPSSLRAFLMFLLKMRNRSASAQLSPNVAVVWNPFVTADAMEVSEPIQQPLGVPASQAP